MSAEIDSLERKAVSGTENSMEEAVTAVDELKIESDERDPVDFLLSNSKYHDCFLTVGNPETDKIERIGVGSLYLIANSPVFQKMLDSYKQAELPLAEIIVSDVSPVVFKLMLRFLYGGELPKMTSIETAGLALCADKYKITRLVQETLKRLTPTSAEDVFPALICVTYTNFPDLEVQVCKIIQQETDKVVDNADFLKLDEACVLFMLKQETLNIDEVELWRHVVRWAEHQVETNPARTVRDCLVNILGHVRFLTLNIEDILEHVLLTKALTPEEFVDLACAVKKEEPLKSSLLCSIKEKRGIYLEVEVNAQSTLGETDKTKDEGSVLLNKCENQPESVVFTKFCVFRASGHFEVVLTDATKSWSRVKIKPKKSIEIVSFTCKSLIGESDNWYPYKCDITIEKTEDKSEYEQDICVEGCALYNDQIVLPLKFNSGKPIVVKPDEKWLFDLNWDNGHPVNELSSSDDTWGDIRVTLTTLEEEYVTVEYHSSFHVVQVAYKTL